LGIYAAELQIVLSIGRSQDFESDDSDESELALERTYDHAAPEVDIGKQCVGERGDPNDHQIVTQQPLATAAKRHTQAKNL
jgi:hypothetical protein